MSELRSGYQQSDVGVIPEDWSAAKIADVGRLQTGPFGTVLKASEYSDDHGVPLISVGEIKLGKIVLRPDTPVVDTQVVHRLPRYLIREGDILFGRKGGVDRSAPVSRQQDGWFLGSDGIRLRPNSGYASQFLAYQFQTQRIQHWLLENSVGTTMPSMNEAVLSQVGFPLPPTEQEQKAIVEALGDADALIEGLEALIAKKRDIKQGAMQELLTGDRRLPGFGTRNPTDRVTEAGRLPTDWSVSTVGDQFRVELGKMLDDVNNVGTPLPYLGNRAVQWDNIDVSEIGAMRIAPFEQERFRLRRGDLLVCEGGEVGRAAVWNEPIAECYYQKALHRLRPKGTYNPRLMAAYLRHWSNRDILQNYVTQTSIAHLPKEKFITVPLPCPGAREQQAIADVLSDMDAEITALENKLAKARAVKQGMMQVLLTGEIRLI